MKLRKKHARPSAPPDMRLLTLCICFLIGMLAAWPVHRRIGSEALAQLGAYVQSYAQLAEGRVQQPSSVLSTAAAYLRCPLLAFLCGLSAAGAVLIPALCMVQGFCLSFSVCCFAASLGHQGRTAGAGGTGAPVPVPAAVHALHLAGRFFSRLPDADAEATCQKRDTVADAAVLCVCASYRYGGGVRHCTEIFRAYSGAAVVKRKE